MVQTILFFYSDMKECNYKTKLNCSKIIRINRKLTWEGTAIIENLEGFRTFVTVRIQYGFEFPLLKSQVLRCIEIILHNSHIVPIDGMNINLMFDYRSYELNAY